MPPVAQIWRQMSENRRAGVRWATDTVLAKAHRPRFDSAHLARTFWVATDWATYRGLIDHARLDPAQFESWLGDYYRRMLYAGHRIRDAGEGD